MRRVGLILLFGGGALIALVVVGFAVLASVYRVPTQSMEPTIGLGDRFVALKVGDPGLGDVVVHYSPAGAGQEARCGGGAPEPGRMCAIAAGEHARVKFVKRIVAVGGDRISMRKGKLIRNGKPETTGGVRGCGGEACDFPGTIEVPKGTYYMLGDNRGASDDSRFWGPVKTDWVVGTYWFGL